MKLESIIYALRARASKKRKENKRTTDPYRMGLNDGLAVAYEIASDTIEQYLKEQVEEGGDTLNGGNKAIGRPGR